MTITDFCEVTRNWFDVNRHFGDFKIENGTIELDFLHEGQYFRIIGSIFNDGAHQYSDSLKLTNEEFNGAIWALSIPQTVIDLVNKINSWEQTNSEALNSPYSSESFGGYSYSKENNADGSVTWQSHFKKDLERWQKI